MNSIDFEDFGRSRLEVKTFGFLLERFDEGRLVLDPPFQRKYVWDASLERDLISTIYCGGDVGRVMFNKRVLDGNTKFLCIDGRQRLTALQKYKENKFKAEIDDEMLFFREMNEKQREKFKEQKIPIRIYDELSEEKQSKLFRLTQNGKPLSTGELANGVNNSSSRLIRRLKKNLPSGIFTAGIEKRMGETDALCRLVYLCDTINGKKMGQVDHQLFHNAEKCSEWLLTTIIEKKQEKRLLKSFEHFLGFLKEGGELSDKKVASFIYLAHLIYIHEKKISDEGKRQRYKIIKRLKKKVEDNLTKTSATNYYLRSFLVSHVKTTKQPLEDLDS
nr:putative nuclease [Marseillevirus cajuinensis]